MSQIPLEVSRRRRVIRIAVAYALVAALYIAVSDMVVVFVTHNDPGQLTGWQNIKGFCFVLFTSLALLLLLWRHDRTEQKAVQEILGARESFEQLFEATPVPLVLYHTETLGILAANPAAFVQFGCSRESLLGLTFPPLYAAGEAEKSRPIPRESAGDRWSGHSAIAGRMEPSLMPRSIPGRSSSAAIPAGSS